MQPSFALQFEWETRRALLLGKGGFHLITPDDQLYSIFAGGERRGATSLNCYQCHIGKGIHSVGIRIRLFEDQLARPPEFRATNRAGLDRLTAWRARAMPGWTLLHWLCADQPAR